MKTKEQIKKWLASQPWFPEYVDKLLDARSKETAITFLNGEQENLTISGAFGWAPEWKKWNERNEAFELWLKSETFENIERGQLFYYNDKRYIKAGNNTAFEANELIRFPETCEVRPL